MKHIIMMPKCEVRHSHVNQRNNIAIVDDSEHPSHRSKGGNPAVSGPSRQGLLHVGQVCIRISYFEVCMTCI